MNWAKFKDPVFHKCLAGVVVACRSLTQEMASLSPITVMTNIFVTEFSEFSETFRKNSIIRMIVFLNTSNLCFEMCKMM